MKKIILLLTLLLCAGCGPSPSGPARETIIPTEHGPQLHTVEINGVRYLYTWEWCVRLGAMSPEASEHSEP
jgi:hypothetical protein